MSLEAEIKDALPIIEELYAHGWDVKLSLRPLPTEQQPHLRTVTLYKPRLGRGIRGAGDTLTQALEAAQTQAIVKLTGRAERWKGEE